MNDVAPIDVIATRSLSVTIRPDRVARIRLDVPGAPVNTLGASFAEELEHVVAALTKHPQVDAAVLVSGKPEGFIAGADLAALQKVHTAAEAEALCRRGQRAIEALARGPKPVVAAIHGPALGGGFEVALACHGRVLTDDPTTVLGLPEVQLGLLPALGGLPRLAAILGVRTTLEYALTGKPLHATAAKALGVVDAIVPRARLVDAAAELADKLARRGGRAIPRARKLSGAPARAAIEKNPLGRALFFHRAHAAVVKETGGRSPASLAILDVLRTYAAQGFEAAREVEARAFGELAVSAMAARLIELSFATTALEEESGADDAVEPLPIATIAVLGADRMGAEIAYLSAEAGLSVRLVDRDAAELAAGLHRVADRLDERRSKKQLAPAERAGLLGRLSGTTDPSGLVGADLVIGTAIDAPALPPTEVELSGAIFASTSALTPIATLTQAVQHPDKVVGLHYGSPARRAPLLEVVRTAATAPEVVAAAVALGKRQGKQVIVVNDGPGFYTHRILGALLNEALHLLADGAPIEALDRAMTAWGWSAGPIALLDELGLDALARSASFLHAAFGPRMKAPPLLEKLVAADREAHATGRTFTLRVDAASPTVDELLGLPRSTDDDRPAIAAEEIQMRCSLQLVNEAIRCWSDGILRSPRDGDVGAIFGLGFPPFRGGPFRYADVLGARELLRRVESYERRFGARWIPAPALVEMAAQRTRFYQTP